MKKVLIITYYWPPAGGPGVQRWLKFVKYLPEFNIEPIVYIPENPTYPIIDKALIEEVDGAVTIIKRKIREPYWLASLFSRNKSKKISSGIIPNKKKQSFIESFLLWVRGNLFIPDARFLWIKPSVYYLKKYIKENNIDIIITTGPPHSLHLIGLELKNTETIKWIADFRDPWTTIGYHKELKLSVSVQEKHKNLEKKVLQTADLILTTSKTTKSEFENLTDQPIEILTNGFDVEKVKKLPLDKKFTLAHIGSFLSERNPIILWKCLKELVKEISGFKKHLELKLIGAVSQDVLDAITEFKLDSYLNNMGYLSHKEAIQQQRCSQLLLLIEINSEETKSIIPSKIFEYMASERPILALGPEESDFAEMIQSTNTGVFITYCEKQRLKEVIMNYYNDYLEGKLQSYAVDLQKYSRKKITENLATILKR